jgi:hypothetical protein
VLGDELRLLLRWEVPAFGQVFDAHVVGVLAEVVEERRRDDRIGAAVQPQRRRRQAPVAVAPAQPGRVLVELERAVDLLDGARPRGSAKRGA